MRLKPSATDPDHCVVLIDDDGNELARVSVCEDAQDTGDVGVTVRAECSGRQAKRRFTGNLAIVPGAANTAHILLSERRR